MYGQADNGKYGEQRYNYEQDLDLNTTPEGEAKEYGSESAMDIWI